MGPGNESDRAGPEPALQVRVRLECTAGGRRPGDLESRPPPIPIHRARPDLSHGGLTAAGPAAPGEAGSAAAAVAAAAACRGPGGVYVEGDKLNTKAQTPTHN